MSQDLGAPRPASTPAALGRFAVRHRLPISFIAGALSLAGLYTARLMPSSIFPPTDFPRCVILVDNGVMPADEMMATITRPIEEAMKDIPGAVSVKSATGRGAAEINVFFDWQVDMVQSELYVNSRLSQIRSQLPPKATATVWRLTFAAFPIIGVSLTSERADLTSLWETARYEIKPRFLRIPGVARVDLVGGRVPEYHVRIDPLALSATGLSITEVTDALERNNLVSSAGMQEEEHQLFLTVVDGRARGAADIEDFVVRVVDGHPVRVRDFGRVVRGPRPTFQVVTADGRDAVLLNIRSQPEGSTLAIADALQNEMARLREILPPDLELAYFYDQSLLVRESVGGVWEAILVGVLLSAMVLYAFLADWGSTLTALIAIPVTILVTVLAMAEAGLHFDLMTLGGIAAAIGLVIDDAIVVVEAIAGEVALGRPRLEAIQTAVSEIQLPLVGSTLTPVVVFLPLTFLDGVTGVFFRALAITMVVALLTSLALSLTLTPSLAAWFVREPSSSGGKLRERRRALARVLDLYELAVRGALAQPLLTLLVCAAFGTAGAGLYRSLESDFLPRMDEGGFIIDYHTPWGTSLSETDRQLRQAEAILREHPDVESYSRRTGARLALAIAEPNTGDFLVKLTPDRRHSTEEVISDLRKRLRATLPGIEWDFPGILSDLIGDLTWSPKPIEVKLFSNDVSFLTRKAPEIEALLAEMPGVVDTFDGLVYTGPSLALRIRMAEARRMGLESRDVATAVKAAMLGRVASSVLEADRVLDIRVRAATPDPEDIETLRFLPLRTPDGRLVQLGQLARLVRQPGQLELRREDLRQDVAVTARLSGRDLGGAMREIRHRLATDPSLPPGSIELGGLYEQQQRSFANLLRVLLAAVLLVFTLLLIEFGSFAEPVAIVFGAVLALFGALAALHLTGTSFNVVSFLGAIIGIGIVAKNGILMLDRVARMRTDGSPLVEALVQSGRHRLRPVLMTSLTTLLAMLPLAYGIGSGAGMLRPLAIAIIGALLFSVLLSLIATPVVYALLARSNGSTAQNR